ncbi:MAG: hypothetical protein EXS37_03130 [Opitutus sp.]|nr:hypothetical protein [Opitutus sp.]
MPIAAIHSISSRICRGTQVYSGEVPAPLAGVATMNFGFRLFVALATASGSWRTSTCIGFG